MSETSCVSMNVTILQGTGEASTQDLLIRYTCWCGGVLLFHQASTRKLCPGCGAWVDMLVIIDQEGTL